MEPQAWVQTLETGGPWAIVVALTIAVVALARAYVQSRNDRDIAMEAVSNKLTGLLTQVVQASERQAASNAVVADVLEKIERRLEVLANAKGGRDV